MIINLAIGVGVVTIAFAVGGYSLDSFYTLLAGGCILGLAIEAHINTELINTQRNYIYNLEYELWGDQDET